MISGIAPYRKFIVALAAAVGVLVTATVDGSLDGAEIAAVVTAFLGSLGVYGFRNEPLPE